MRRLQGSVALLFDAVEQTTRLVQRTHRSVAARSTRPLSATAATAPATAVVMSVHKTTADGVYRTILGVNRLTGALVNAGVQHLMTRGSDSGAATRRAGPVRAGGSDAIATARWLDYAESAVNALYGDALHTRRNSLDLGMAFRQAGQPMALDRASLRQRIVHPSGKVVVFVHGLGCTEREWNIGAHAFHGDPDINFGSLLERDLGYTPLYVRYNTGRHISENGRLLSTLLTRLMDTWPVDIRDVVLVGHSMGGLVARSAAHYGRLQGDAWTNRLRHVCCLGTPNLGAPLEKGVNLLSWALGAFATAGTQVPAEILNARSAGIKDLRFGYTLDEEWGDHDPDGLLEDNRRSVPLVDGVGYSFVAATVTRDPDHPMGMLLGDLLVRVPSAAGEAPEPARRIPFRSGRVLSGISHLQIANHPEVYRTIHQQLEPLLY